MQKFTGIWLDQKQAFLIHFNNGKSIIQSLESNIEDYHVLGGSRSKTPWGPMDNVSEKKALERRKAQFKQYFKSIITEIMESNEVYLFGPAQTKNMLAETILQDKNLKTGIRKVETADKMTERQMIAQVRKVFKMQPSKS